MAGKEQIMCFSDSKHPLMYNKHLKAHEGPVTFSEACSFIRRLLATMAGLSSSLLPTILCTAFLTYIILLQLDVHSAGGRAVAREQVAQHRSSAATSAALQDCSGTAAELRIVQPRGPNRLYVLLPGRWPLPDIPVALYNPQDGSCVLDERVCSNMPAYFVNENVHARDLVASALMKCVFKSGCRAADIGGNLGMMTYTMLALGAHVTTIEPQMDLVDVIRRTGELNGWSNRLKVIWGGVGWQPGQENLQLDMSNPFLYRIGGNNRHGIVKVPLFNVSDVLEPGHYNFVNIDTDSIECLILADVLTLVQSGRISVDSLFLKTYVRSCRNGFLAKLLTEFQQLGYTVYRTLLWERQFFDNGTLPTPLAVDAALPPYATEVFDVRFARYLWKLAPMTEQQWAEVMNPRIWQLFITREDLRSSHMTITERT